MNPFDELDHRKRLKPLYDWFSGREIDWKGFQNWQTSLWPLFCFHSQSGPTRPTDEKESGTINLAINRLFMYQTIFEVEKSIGNGFRIVKLFFFLHLVHQGQLMKKSLKPKILQLISSSCTKTIFEVEKRLKIVSKLSDLSFPSNSVSSPFWSTKADGWKRVCNKNLGIILFFMYQTIFEVEKSIGNGFRIVRLLFLLHLVHQGQLMKLSLTLNYCNWSDFQVLGHFLRSRNRWEMV